LINTAIFILNQQIKIKMVEFRHVAKGLSQANKSNKKSRSKSGGKIEVSL